MKIAIMSVANFAYGTRAAKWLEQHVPNSKYVAMPNYDSSKPGWEQSRQIRRKIREQQEAKYRIEIYQGEKASARRKRNTWHVVLGSNSLANFQLLKRFVGGALRLSGKGDKIDNPQETDIPHTSALEKDEEIIDMDVLSVRDEPALDDIPDDCLCEIMSFLGSSKDYYALRGLSRNTARCFAQETSWWCTLNVSFITTDVSPTQKMEYVRKLSDSRGSIQYETWAFFPNLIELDWSDNREITDSGVHDINEMLQIDMSGNRRKSDIDVQYMVKYCKKLRILYMRTCPLITDRGIKVLARGCKQLTSLDVSRCELITDEGVKALADGCKQLTSLNVRRCYEITDAGIRALGSGCRQLKHLNINYLDKITDDGIYDLTDGCRNLTHLALSNCELVTGNGIRVLGEKCKRLTRLILRRCKLINDDGLRALANGCKQLIYLDLWDCIDVTGKGIEAIAGSCKDLSFLILSGCDQITDNTIWALSEGCRQLRTLHLHACSEITDKGMEALAAGCKQLTNLDLKSCTSITDDGMKALAGGCRQLTDLNIDHCLLSDNTLRALGVECKRLKILSMSDCSRISDEGLKSLADGCKELERVIARNCRLIRAPGMEALLIRCKKLKMLDVRGSPNVFFIHQQYRGNVSILE